MKTKQISVTRAHRPPREPAAEFIVMAKSKSALLGYRSPDQQTIFAWPTEEEPNILFFFNHFYFVVDIWLPLFPDAILIVTGSIRFFFACGTIE